MLDTKQDLNGHIKKHLTELLNNKVGVNYATLIDGDWGVGKTYYIKGFAEKLDVKEYSYTYISLFGKKTTKEIDEEISQQFFKTKLGVIADKAFKHMPAALGLTTKVFTGVNSTKVLETFSKMAVEVIEKKSEEGAKQSNLIIFDDLERTLIPAKEVLGYISQIIEGDTKEGNKEVRVVVVCNEKQIPEGEWKEDYQNFKEKVISKTLMFKPSFELYLQSFIEQSGDEFKQAIEPLREEILNIGNKLVEGNLRVLKIALLELKSFHDEIQDKGLDEKLISYLLLMYLVLSLGLKKEQFDLETLKSIKSLNSLEYSTSPDKDKRLFVSSILNFIPRDIFNKHRVISPIFWIKVFDEQKVDIEALKEINTFIYRNDWSKLVSPWLLDDGELKEEYDRVVKYLEEKTPTSLSEVFRLLDFIHYYGEVNDDFESIDSDIFISAAQKYIDEESNKEGAMNPQIINFRKADFHVKNYVERNSAAYKLETEILKMRDDYLASRIQGNQQGSALEKCKSYLEALYELNEAHVSFTENGKYISLFNYINENEVSNSLKNASIRDGHELRDILFKRVFTNCYPFHQHDALRVFNSVFAQDTSLLKGDLEKLESINSTLDINKVIGNRRNLWRVFARDVEAFKKKITFCLNAAGEDSEAVL